MEAPRFIKNKTVGFSSAVLALSLIACADKEATKFTTTPTEQNFATADVIVGMLKDQNIDQSELDHTCGITLEDGQSKKFRIPTLTRPYDIDFEIEVNKLADGSMSVGNVPLEFPTYLGVVSPGKTDEFRLGLVIPFKEKGEIFFAPFIESKQYLVDGCAPTT